MEYRIIDQGHSKSGVHWQILQPKFRYCKIWEVRVNGKATQFRNKNDAYEFLEETKVTNFNRVTKEGKQEYDYKQVDPEDVTTLDDLKKELEALKNGTTD